MISESKLIEMITIRMPKICTVSIHRFKAPRHARRVDVVCVINGQTKGAKIEIEDDDTEFDALTSILPMVINFEGLMG